MGHNPFRGLTPDQAVQARITHDFIPVDLPRWVQEVLLKATHPTTDFNLVANRPFTEERIRL